MRKQYKNKKRCCGLCKPHKRGWSPRFKDKERLEAREDQKIIDLGIENLYDLYMLKAGL